MLKMTVANMKVSVIKQVNVLKKFFTTNDVTNTSTNQLCFCQAK